MHYLADFVIDVTTNFCDEGKKLHMCKPCKCCTDNQVLLLIRFVCHIHSIFGVQCSNLLLFQMQLFWSPSPVCCEYV